MTVGGADYSRRACECPRE